MITLGIDAHKRTHTVIAVDDVGHQLNTKTTTTTTNTNHLNIIQ